jgi:hypothetical protein
MLIVAPYYTQKHKGPRTLKNKVLIQQRRLKSFPKHHLRRNSITETPTVSCKHLHRCCLNFPAPRLHHLAILLLLKQGPKPNLVSPLEDNLQIRWC